MSGLAAGGGGYDAANRVIERKILECLNNLPNFSSTCSSQNQVKTTFLPSRKTEILPTRDIIVRLENSSDVYVVMYNTADNTHTVTNPPGGFGLSPTNLEFVLSCVRSAQAGGKRRRSKNRTKRVKRKYSHKRR